MMMPVRVNTGKLLPMNLETVSEYCHRLVESNCQQLKDGKLLIKVLTDNDDSGRHGVLIPQEAYDFFPELQIDDPAKNATRLFHGIDCLEKLGVEFAYKYYERYPERRITRFNTIINDREQGLRIVIFLKARHADGTTGYYFDAVVEKIHSHFKNLAKLFFGDVITLYKGQFILKSIDAGRFVIDEPLGELLEIYDGISSRGWVDSLRSGDTGIGYTFETLAKITENNNREADYKGIEIKCKQLKSRSGTGKINLFQQGPVWIDQKSAVERIRVIGQPDEDGRYSCYSQVTTEENNLGLWLDTQSTANQIDLLKSINQFGYWKHNTLAQRLSEKHSRSVFIKAEVKNTKAGQKFKYCELVYCEMPTITNFLDLVNNKKIVFEFMMREDPEKGVRNHGYPWRLSSEDYLTSLFSFKTKLR